MWGLESLQQCENFFDILFSSLWIAHMAGMEFDFIVIVHLPSHCGFSFVIGSGVFIFFVCVWVLTSSYQWLFNSYL